MKAVTKVYVYPSVTASFTVFGSTKEIGAVYAVTNMENGNVYLNTAEYPFHYELSNTVVTLDESGTAYITYVSEVE